MKTIEGNHLGPMLVSSGISLDWLRKIEKKHVAYSMFPLRILPGFSRIPVKSDTAATHTRPDI
jgi:hypothetical protein